MDRQKRQGPRTLSAHCPGLMLGVDPQREQKAGSQTGPGGDGSHEDIRGRFTLRLPGGPSRPAGQRPRGARPPSR